MQTKFNASQFIQNFSKGFHSHIAATRDEGGRVIMRASIVPIKNETRNSAMLDNDQLGAVLELLKKPAYKDKNETKHPELVHALAMAKQGLILYSRPEWIARVDKKGSKMERSGSIQVYTGGFPLKRP